MKKRRRKREEQGEEGAGGRAGGRVSNSRFESDAAGGVVQLRKPVEFEISNFRAVPFCDQNMRVD